MLEYVDQASIMLAYLRQQILTMGDEIQTLKRSYASLSEEYNKLKQANNDRDTNTTTEISSEQSGTSN